ncbi:phage tail protein [Acinetobacter nosocomialis]|uniref:phage tail protein n=1 Tax=Acinetobacter nosocomialis TaxID=106654 RepID=UPI001D0E11C7|nr:phage tail protein [Acinetobacter nosocomialis]
MAALYHSLFTEKGLALLRESIQNGTKLGITHMSFGDGGGMLPTPDATFTHMVNEVYRVALNRLAPSRENPNWLEADGVIPSAVGGFNIREVGLWAGNVMVAYANYPPTYKPSGDQGTAQIKSIRIVLQIDNTANFELKIDASIVMATIQSVEDAKLEVIDFANKTKISIVESIHELLMQDVWEGKTIYVKSYHSGYNKGGGNFIYNSLRKSENDGGNLLNGWVRQVSESYFNVHNFGGIGEGIYHNSDHDAFVKISNAVLASNIEAITIHIPDGEYIVGKQSFIAGQGFTFENILSVIFPQMTNKTILLKSDGAKIKLKDGLYFGIFDKNTKEPFQTTMPFYPGTPSWAVDGAKVTRANTGYIVNFENIKSLVFSGKIDIDGNQENQIIGGQYGDSGWQLMAYGFRVVNIKQLSLENIYTHDHLLDGFYIAGYNSLTEPDKVLSDVFGSVRNVVSYHNSRQACSFCGGQNISFYDCTFSDTATVDMKVRSMPMSGLDIEAEVSPIRNARFYNLKSFNNAATQVVADSGDTKNVHFYSSRFLSPKGGVTAWVRKPQFKFFNCYFNGYMEGQYGTNIEEDRTLYQGCTFTDDPSENANVEATTYLINAHGANPKFEDCKFNIYKSGWLYDYGYSGSIDRLTVKNSEFNIYTESAWAAMNGVYENIVINDLRADPTKTIYPTLDGGRYNNVVVKSPTGVSGIALYGSTSLANNRNAVFIRSSNPYDVLEITPFELKGFHVAGNQGVSSLVKVGYSPFLNLMNIQYNTGDIIHCTMPSSGIDKWICITSGIGTESIWKKVPLTLQDI